jgi:hypothetical protein
VNLVRNYVDSASVFGLSLALGLGLVACKPDAPVGTSNPPGDSGNAAASDGGGDDGYAGDGAAGSSADGGDGGGGKACEAKVAEAPTPLFGEKVLIRPPINVELVEENPAFATTFASGGFVSACEATVDRMMLFVLPSDPKKPVAKYMDEVIEQTLTQAGYQNGTRGDDVVSTETDVHSVIEYPAGGGQPPAKLYVAVSRKFTNILVVVYQTRPDEFSALKPTFRESAESLLVLPPDA